MGLARKIMDRIAFEGQPYQPICDAYDGKCIFVTGGTGFLGKVLVEKILYRCSKIAKIYVLMRNTEKISAEEKLKKMLNCPIFKRLRDERPENLEKIIPIVGDITKPQLGIEYEVEKLLVNTVSMVFHLAATVRFDEPLQIAIDTNMEGTRRVLELCTKIKNLHVFVYVSTAFSNANRKEMDEIVYPPVIPFEDVDKIMQQDAIAEEQTKNILNGMPNTYTLAKGLAESLVAKFHEERGLPAIIVRPSIVVSCAKEPLSGWIDNWLGATACVVTISKGITRALCGSGNNVIDLIPADYVANVIVVSAARYQRTNHVEVYNSCSSAVNPITLMKLNRHITEDSIKHKFYDMPWPGVMFLESRWILNKIIFLLEILPAYLLDFLLQLKGKEGNYMKMMSKVAKIRAAIEPFTSRTWSMRAQNTSNLAETLSSSDRIVFACDATTLNWNEFIPIYLHGVRKYLLGFKT